MKNKPKKNKFIGALTPEERYKIEKRYYTIQVGHDFMRDEDGTFAFTEKVALSHMNSVFIQLNKLLKDDTVSEEDKEEARRMLSLLKMEPIKFH